MTFVGADRKPSFGCVVAVFGSYPSEWAAVLHRRATVFDLQQKYHPWEQTRFIE